MMNNTYTQLLALTQKMLAHCETKDWDQLLACEQEREVLIQKITEKPLTTSNEDSNKLREIITLNEKILEISISNKEHYGQSLLELKRNTKKTSLYKD